MHTKLTESTKAIYGDLFNVISEAGQSEDLLVKDKMREVCCNTTSSVLMAVERKSTLAKPNTKHKTESSKISFCM